MGHYKHQDKQITNTRATALQTLWKTYYKHCDKPIVTLKQQSKRITNTVTNLLQAHYKRRGKEPDTPHKSCLIVPAWPGRQLEILQRRPLMFLTIVVVFNTIYQCFDIVELELVWLVVIDYLLMFRIIEAMAATWRDGSLSGCKALFQTLLSLMWSQTVDNTKELEIFCQKLDCLQ